MNCRKIREAERRRSVYSWQLRRTSLEREDDLRKALDWSPFSNCSLAVLPRRDQPLRKLSEIGKMRHYLHATKVSMMGRERRHFREQNEASIHTDQRFHYKICLQRKEGLNKQHRQSLGSTDGDRGARSPEPTLLASEAVVTCTGTRIGVRLSGQVKDQERHAGDRNA